MHRIATLAASHTIAAHGHAKGRDRCAASPDRRLLPEVRPHGA
jgi:hypothetical protein